MAMIQHLPIKFSAEESKRFGYKIWRGEVETFNAAFISELITSEKPDIIILRVPADQKFLVNQLAGNAFQLLHCDTILYYEYNLEGWTPEPLKNNLQFHAVTASTQQLVDTLIAENFQDYKNHYYANPLLDNSKITEGYKEWAQTFTQQADRFSWYVTLNNEVVAFMLCETGVDNSCQPVLSAVKKEHRKKGIYADIFTFIKTFFQQRGVVTMKAVTQVHNYVSNQILIKEGFNLKRSFDTYHINCINAPAGNDIS